jgi:hypothetical protein
MFTQLVNFIHPFAPIGSVILTWFGVGYALFNEARNWFAKRKRITVHIVEWTTLIKNGDNNDGIAIRMHINNDSLTPVIINTIALTPYKRVLFKYGMIASPYKHVLTFDEIPKENYKEPIYSSDFPINIPGKTGTIATVLVSGKLVDPQTGFIALATSKGGLSIRPKTVSAERIDGKFK